MHGFVLAAGLGAHIRTHATAGLGAQVEIGAGGGAGGGGGGIPQLHGFVLATGLGAQDLAQTAIILAATAERRGKNKMSHIQE